MSVRDHPCVRTPHLDALARAGVVFAAHYAQASPCGPSRATMHTGLYLMNHRSVTNGTPLDRRHRNWAQVMRAAGWNPVLFGYTDTSADPRDYPSDHPALRTYEGILPGLDALVHVNLGDTAAWCERLAQLGYAVPADPTRIYYQKAAGTEWEDGGATPLPLAIAAADHDTRFLTDCVIDYVTEQRNRPWCVHLSLLRPHPPWIAPAPYNAMYPPHQLPPYVRAATPEAEAAQHPWLAAALGQTDTRLPIVAPDKARRLQASYYGLMSEVDDNLGRLFAALEETGQWHDTFIVFTSDHGEQMGDHWMLGKAGYFDQSYHVPLIIRDPTATERHGSTVTEFTEHVDVMPTLLDRVGLSTPVECDGRSLCPFLRSDDTPPGWRTEAHWEYDFRDMQWGDVEIPLHGRSLCVLRGARHKYVHFAALPPVLFDLECDPDELCNLAAEPDHATVVAQCAQQMLNWRMQHAEHGMTNLRLSLDGVVTRAGFRW